MDIGGLLTETSKGNEYFLTFQDELSKYTMDVPIQQKDAMTVERAYVEQLILKFGIPQLLLTDQGSKFLSDLIGNVFKLLRIKRIKTSPYNPQTDGALERTQF